MLRRLFIAILLLTLGTACAGAPSTARPVVDVVSPLDGALFAPGEQVNLRVAAASSNNIARVEVHSAGVLIASQDNATPAPTFTASLSFVPRQAGELQLIITAIDSTGKTSDPLNLSIVVGSGSLLGESVTATPGAGGTPAGQTTDGCKLAATFVSDVTIPDNTAVNPGTSFVKTWRLRNTSACAWETGYALAFSEGEQMGAPSSVTVPPTAPDAAIDVSVPFTAPTSSGAYTSTWRMRAPDGTPFGNRVYVTIRVP